MKKEVPISLKITIRDFIRLIWFRRGSDAGVHLIAIFRDLIESGCDFYELLDLYTEYPVSEGFTHILSSYCPEPASIASATYQNIRENIYRWGPSKCKENSITFVVETIHQLIFSRSYGISIYNSNINSSNRNCANDKYVLLITNEHCLFFDISRKRTVKFVKTEDR